MILTLKLGGLMTSTTRLKQIRRDLLDYGADPYQIAAEAVERGDRLLEQVNRLQKALSQVPGLEGHEQHCSGNSLPR
tara:strand:- start:1472 stop:1702 length:231 start_codon:yes stop_codon:yes gene_type:complete